MPHILVILVKKQLEIFNQNIQQVQCKKKNKAAFDVFSKLHLLETKLKTHPYQKKKKNPTSLQKKLNKLHDESSDNVEEF